MANIIDTSNDINRHTEVLFISRKEIVQQIRDREDVSRLRVSMQEFSEKYQISFFSVLKQVGNLSE